MNTSIFTFHNYYNIKKILVIYSIFAVTIFFVSALFNFLSSTELAKQNIGESLGRKSYVIKNKDPKEQTKSIPEASSNQRLDSTLSQHPRITNNSLNKTNIKSPVKNIALPAVLVAGCSLEVASSKTNPTPTATTYLVEIRNKGIETCQNASISVYYTSDEGFISSSPKPTASNYYWLLGRLKSGDMTQLTFTTDKSSSNTAQTESCVTADNANQDACTIFKENNAITASSASEPTATEKSSAISVAPIVLDQKENGLWVWKSPISMNQAYRDFIISTAEKNNFNAVYVTVDDYLDIAFLPEGTAKNEQKKKYMNALELLVKQASLKGISIDAEAGWRDWAEPNNTYKPFAVIDFVKEYNASRTYKLRALQYDIEPYLMSTYEKNKASILKNFVTLIDQTVGKLNGSNIPLNVVIPHFYDETQRWTPSFIYNGKNTFTFNHLLTILEKSPNNSIILMSYRNFANGKNGTIEISKAEIEKATGSSYKTKIIVAQETGNVDPDYVTFFNTSKNYFTEQTNIVKKTFLPYRNFGGMATHYLEMFVELK